MLAALVLLAGVLAPAPVLHIDMPYLTIGAAHLTLDIAIPGERVGPHPIIVCLRGGGWSMEGKGSFKKYLSQFAGRGYAAAALQYRLAPTPNGGTWTPQE